MGFIQKLASKYEKHVAVIVHQVILLMGKCAAGDQNSKLLYSFPLIHYENLRLRREKHVAQQGIQ